MNASEPFVLLDGSPTDDVPRIEPFLLLDGSVDDATRIVSKIENAVGNPIVDKLYIKDVDLNKDNGGEIKASLQRLILLSPRRWSAVDIDNCTGPIHFLISLVLESSPAGVVSFGLDSIVLDSDVELALERGIGVVNNRKTRLSTLQLLECKLSVSNVVSLLQGLKYSDTIETLSFHNSRFDHEAASELSRSAKASERWTFQGAICRKVTLPTWSDLSAITTRAFWSTSTCAKIPVAPLRCGRLKTYWQRRRLFGR
jgi:hypothetical protein